MPAEVELKLDGMSRTSGGGLLRLTKTAGHDLVAVWRKCDKKLGPSACTAHPGLAVDIKETHRLPVSFLLWPLLFTAGP
jgi:hypothetical protein